MNKYNYYVILVLLLGSFITTAQVNLNLMFVNESNSKPIVGVSVFCETTQQLTNSDAEGSAKILLNTKGDCKFIFFAEAYKTKQLTLILNEDSSLIISLKKLSVELSAIEIAAEKKERFAIKQLKDVEGTSIYAGKKTEVVLLDLVKGNLASNVSRQILAEVPGLNIYEGSEGGIQLSIGARGLDPNRTSNFNTRQNGYDISADVLGYPENYYTPPAQAIDEIQIIRGASSLQYGTQFGGLINFKLHRIPSYKKYNLKLANTIGNNGLFDTYSRIGLNYKKISANFYYNFKRGNGFRENAEFNLHNAHLHLQYNFSKQTSIEGETTFYKYLAKQAGGLTDLQFEKTPQLSTRNRNWFAVNWLLYNLKFKHQFAANHNISLSLFALDANRKSVGFRGNAGRFNENPITALDEQDENDNYISARDLIVGKYKNYGAELRWLKQYFIKKRKAVLLLGAKYYNANNSSIQGPGSSGIAANFEFQYTQFPNYPNQSSFSFPNKNLAFFGEHIFYVNDKLSITPGFRIEYILTKTKGSYNNVVFDNAGNVILNEMLMEEASLPRSFPLFGLGIAYKPIVGVELYSNLSQNYRSVTFNDIRVVNPTFIVDENIKDEKGLTFDVGLRGRIKKQFSYDVSAYSILYNNRIGIVLDNRANRVRTNVGNAVIAGVESLLSANLEEIFMPHNNNIKLNAFINAAYTFSRYYGSKRANIVGKQIEFVPQLNFKTGINFGYKNFESSLQLTSISKQFTDAQNSLIAPFGDDKSGLVGPIPSYSVVDVTMSYAYKQFKINAGINNLFNKAYYTRRATGYPGPGIIPSVGISPFITVVFEP